MSDTIKPFFSMSADAWIDCAADALGRRAEKRELRKILKVGAHRMRVTDDQKKTLAGQLEMSQIERGKIERRCNNLETNARDIDRAFDDLRRQHSELIVQRDILDKRAKAAEAERDKVLSEWRDLCEKETADEQARIRVAALKKRHDATAKKRARRRA